jgi:catechol 2,3-dioxygenase-like lactoylglutathione lyase family enzyme
MNRAWTDRPGKGTCGALSQVRFLVAHLWLGGRLEFYTAGSSTCLVDEGVEWGLVNATWGTRSIYFRDPDGNLVAFYTPPRVQQ